MNIPRVAFFTDSYHEVNGVALTSREFVRFAVQKEYPFLSVHAGPKTRSWREGALHTLEIASSPLVLRLEHDLKCDLLFYRHHRRVYKELREFRPDLIHVTGPSHSGMLGAILAHELKVPLVASWHTNLHEFAARRVDSKLSWLGHRWRTAITDFTESETLAWTLRFYRLARLLFAPNPELVEMLTRAANRPTYLMKRGIDVQLFSPERRTRTGDEFVIGFVGRLSPEKGVRMLADVERRMREYGITNYRFLIVGDGSERPWLMEHLKQAAFPGVFSGIPLAEAYANMDAFIFPSQTDTFGNVVLEAMASGLVPVVTSSGGPKFLVADGVTGFVAQDSASFVQYVVQLAKDHDLRARMRTRAREFALCRYWHRIFDQVYDAYHYCLNATIPSPFRAPHPPATRSPLRVG